MAVENPPAAPVAVPAAPRVRQTGKLRYAVAGLLVVGALGFLLLRLGDATVYFRTVDEAVAQRAALGERRFRLQGIVSPGTVKQTANGIEFTVEENGASIPVRFAGKEPELFQPNIPVVLEGNFVKGSDVFASDRIMVKHSESYRAENPDRVDDYVGKK